MNDRLVEKDKMVGKMDEVIVEKDKMIEEKDKMIEEKDKRIREKDEAIERLEEFADLATALHEVRRTEHHWKWGQCDITFMISVF